MKNIHQWLTEYGESHRNPTNILIHKICVPLIMLSVLGFLWTLPVPAFFMTVPFLNWATIAMVLSLIFYIRLSWTLTLGILLESLLMLAIFATWTESHFLSLRTFSVGLFVVAWIFQFIGHKIEGKKPSFFKDLQFLLIGPLWTLRPIYKAMRVRV